jgi:hypothetical protein
MKNSNKFEKLTPAQIAHFKKKMQARYPEEDGVKHPNDEAAASKYLNLTKKQRDEDEEDESTDAPVWIDGKI